MRSMNRIKALEDLEDAVIVLLYRVEALEKSLATAAERDMIGKEAGRPPNTARPTSDRKLRFPDVGKDK